MTTAGVMRCGCERRDVQFDEREAVGVVRWMRFLRQAAGEDRVGEPVESGASGKGERRVTLGFSMSEGDLSGQNVALANGGEHMSCEMGVGGVGIGLGEGSALENGGAMGGTETGGVGDAVEEGGI